ncbi:MAG: hypothetical protein IIZ10_06835 [Solobacterium sp.]|nr:hypothetical protein [Solobacterium sp.]
MSNAGERLKYTTAVILYGTIGMFLRNVSLPSEVTAMYRGILGSLFILLFRHLTKHPMGITGWIGTVLVIGSALLGELHGTGQ